MSNHIFRHFSLCSCFTAFILSAVPGLAADYDGQTQEPVVRLAPVVVTATPEINPLSQTLDPRAPAQPIPAHDGADLLKNVPGMSVIRKGGAGGDPVFRGMAGSRLGIQLDGETILGGCGMRMDPPTSYIFPSAYDRVTIRKGPQTVLSGPGNSAGVVLFEHDQPDYGRPAADLHGALTYGSFGRNDETVDLKAGAPLGYVRAAANRSDSDDYKDGDGNPVHSLYERWIATAALGWTPAPGLSLELSGARSDGHAAYADRTMDNVQFDRDNLGLRLRKSDVGEFVRSLDAQVYYNYVDHVMDNYTLRTPPGAPMVGNPDRKTTGGRLAVTLMPLDTTGVTLGTDFQSNRHTLRSTANQLAQPYQLKPRVRDASFDQLGVFGEATHELAAGRRIIGGARFDRWEAEKTVASLHRDETLPAGFVRYEQDFGPTTTYFGLGHAERFPDYWEIIGGIPPKPNGSFWTDAEKTTQLDIGATHAAGPLKASLALFANTIKDYILIQPALVQPTRNIDARTFGGEASVEYAFLEGWTATASLAYVRGTNETDDRPLAQIPPLEGRLGLSYATNVWTAGGLIRLVAPQNRVAPGQGNIVGQDIGESAGFVIFSLNGGWRVNPHAKLTAGVDNLFDKAYAEHISRSGAAIAGYPVTTRVNEPGLTLWVKLDLDF